MQTAHSVAEFAQQFPDKFAQWKEQSNYLISLSVDNEESLKDLYNKLLYYGADVIAFCEPDIQNQMTAFCFYGTPEMQLHIKKLDLALQN